MLGLCLFLASAASTMKRAPLGDDRYILDLEAIHTKKDSFEDS